MNLKNCSQCGCMFTPSLRGNEFCPDCLKQSEENYRKVFEYFKAEPEATAQQISDATGVDVKEIYRFVRENRMRSVKVNTGRICGKCGRPIYGGKLSGKVCDKCRVQTALDTRKDIHKHKTSSSTATTHQKTTHSAHSKPQSDNKKPKKH
jgi:hypothetical protein